MAWRGLACIDMYLEFSRLYDGRGDAILMYHSVGDPSEYGNVSVGRFRRDLEHITDRYTVVDLSEIRQSDADQKRIALTFDDAYKNFYTDAWPVIKEFDVPVTLYVISNAVKGDPHELDSEKLLHRDQLLTLCEDQRVMIGNHTKTHPYLSEVPKDQLRSEIVGAKRELESELDIEVDRFAYPSGDFDPRVLRVVRESHESAVTTRPALICDGNEFDPHRLPRIDAHAAERMVRWDLTDVSWILNRLDDDLGVV